MGVLMNFEKIGKFEELKMSFNLKKFDGHQNSPQTIPKCSGIGKDCLGVCAKILFLL